MTHEHQGRHYPELTPEQEEEFLARQDRNKKRMGIILGFLVLLLMMFTFFYVRHVGLIDFDFTVIQTQGH